VQSKPVDDHAAAGDAHQRAGKSLRPVRCGEDDRCRAIGIWSSIVDVQRRVGRFRTGIRPWLDRLAEHGIRISNRIGMHQEGKCPQQLARLGKFMEIALHQQASLGGGSQPFHGFPVIVCHLGNSGFQAGTDHVGIFFHANNNRSIHKPRSNCQVAHPQSSCAGGIRRFHGPGFNSLEGNGI